MTTNPTGNTATLLNDLSGHSSNTLNGLSDFIGAAADIGGAVSLFSGVVSLVNGGPSVESLLSQLLQTLQTNFSQLNHELGASQILARNTTLNGYLGLPLAHFQSLPNSLQTQPPLTSEAKISQVTDCLAALNQLNGSDPDIVWNVDCDWQVYWNDQGLYTVTLPTGDTSGFEVIDCGYGPQSPPKNDDGLTVFSYTYSLPTYLWAIGIFLTVGGALDPMFSKNYAPEIHQIINVLQAKHDLVVNKGIRPLLPAKWPDDFNSLSMAARPGIRGWSLSLTAEPLLVYHGAVEVFSGASDMNSEYVLWTPGNPTPNSALLEAMYQKLALRTLAKSKQVYLSVGMPSLCSVLRTLNRLIGNTGYAEPQYGYWSLRNDVFPVLNLGGQASVSLRNLVSTLRSTPPNDPVGFVGVRQLLNGF